jgi:hypothetical protein
VANVTLQDLGNVGEFLGAVAVLFSLIYLALQIRQNTRAMRVAAFQDAVRSANTWSAFSITDSGLGPLLRRGAHDLESLDESERAQFDELMLIMLRNYSASVLLEREGFLAEGDISAAYEASIRDLFDSPSIVEWWANKKHFIAPSSQESISNLLAAQGVEPDAE